MPDRMPTDTLPGEMHEARNKAIEAATYALWQDSDAPKPVCAERARIAVIAVNAAWDSLGPLFDKLIARPPAKESLSLGPLPTGGYCTPGTQARTPHDHAACVANW